MYYRIVPSMSAGSTYHVVDMENDLAALQARIQVYCSGHTIPIYAPTHFVETGNVTCVENGSVVFTHVIEVAVPTISNTPEIKKIINPQNKAV